jgi:MoeA C-terminal region (domain IV)
VKVGWNLPDGDIFDLTPLFPQVKTTGNQGCGVLSSMVQATGLIVLHHSQGHVMDALMLDGAM